LLLGPALIAVTGHPLHPDLLGGTTGRRPPSRPGRSRRTTGATRIRHGHAWWKTPGEAREVPWPPVRQKVPNRRDLSKFTSAAYPTAFVPRCHAPVSDPSSTTASKRETGWHHAQRDGTPRPRLSHHSCPSGRTGDAGNEKGTVETRTCNLCRISPPVAWLDAVTCGFSGCLMAWPMSSVSPSCHLLCGGLPAAAATRFSIRLSVTVRAAGRPCRGWHGLR
jgi:hypothetical protein